MNFEETRTRGGQTAMPELLGVNFAVAGKDRLYHCLDRLLVHKQGLFPALTAAVARPLGGAL